jgi:SagB-type dehydrogenase family enzyme
MTPKAEPTFIAVDPLTAEMRERAAGPLEDALDFHEGSKLDEVRNARLARRVTTVLNDPAIYRAVKRSWKTYAGADRIALPAGGLGAMTVEEALRRRRSQLGGYTGEAIGLAELATVLKTSYGPTGVAPMRGSPGEVVHYRATCSAGGLYPLEIYPLVFDVDGLEPGLYHYDVRAHALEAIAPGPCKADVLGRMSDHQLGRTTSVMLAITAVLPRTMSKYLFRGYRFALYDVGALVESFYLAATALGLGTCALGGFFDDELGELLGIDRVDEQVMALFTLGRPSPGPLAKVGLAALE